MWWWIDIHVGQKKKEKKGKKILLHATNIKNEHSNKVVTKMTSHILDGFHIQKMGSH